jgi:glycosyltransferase involved in cell wall biosynthesis
VDTVGDPVHAFTATYALGRASAFVCDCDAVRARAHSLMHGTLPAVVQFPWGVDLSVFAPGDRDRHRAALELGPGPVIVSTRLWEEHYGILTVIEAVGRARRQVPDLQLLLLGDGSQRDRVQELIARWDLQRAVTTPGLVSPDALAPYFQAADMYLTCTHSDGASISLLEAMACGLPVVASDIPGNREWLDGQAGSALVPVGDAEAFAAAIVEVGQLSPEAQRERGAANRMTTTQRADWKANVQQLFAAYAAVVAQEARC